MAERLLLIGQLYRLTKLLAYRHESIGGLTPPEPRLFKLMKSIEENEAGHIP